MSFATIIIALALYTDIFNASGIIAGLFGSSYALARLLLVLPIGRSIDIGNSKRYLLGGLGLFVVVLVGYAFVGDITHVVGFRFLQGVSSTLVIIAGTSVIGEISPDEERGFWLGTYNQVKSISSLSGDLVGGALLFQFGFSTTYAVLAAIMCVSTVAVLLHLRDNPGSQADSNKMTGTETFRRLLNRGPVRALVLFRFAFSFGKMAVTLFLPIYARSEFGMSAMAIGWILAGGKLTMALSQGYVGSVSDRIGKPAWFVFTGTLLYGLGTLTIPFAGVLDGIFDPVTFQSFWGADFTITPPFVGLFLSFLTLGIADSIRIPPSIKLFVEEGEQYDAVAGSLSLRSVSWQIGAIVGPVVVGSVLEVGSFFSAFGLASALVVISAITFLYLYEPEPVTGADEIASE